RPAKKPRLDLPDGFAKSSSSTRKIAPMKFVSAFETSTFASQSAKTGVKARMPVSKAPPPPKPAVGDSSAPNKPPVFRVLRPPPLPQLKPGQDGSASRKLTSLVSRPPILLPQQDADTRLVSITSLRPRPATAPTNKKLKPLSSMAPPPIAGPSRLPASKMKTIFTTNVALATDIRTESGQAQLLALYLEQHGHGFVDPTERELRRGLETSPEKLSKHTKNAKFARGGLAGRAKILLKQRQTGLALWQAALEHDLSAKRRPKPDMRVRVMSILHAATDAEHVRTAHSPCLVLLRCAIMPEFRQEEIMLLLNFDAACGASPVRFHKIANVQAGREVFLWKPWQTVDIPPSSVKLLAHPDMKEGSNALASGEAGDVRTVLLCTRFWLAPF
ncbi:hypothetical protein FOMPIDRAFT_1128796, partial [Fomitopsis schrenkii]